MTDYQKYINALRQCAKEHDNDRTPTFNIRVSDLCRDTANLLEEVDQEPKTGHWIDHEKHIECDSCNIWFLKDHLIRKSFCPNCGAKMSEMPTGSEGSDNGD